MSDFESDLWDRPDFYEEEQGIQEDLQELEEEEEIEDFDDFDDFFEEDATEEVSLMESARIRLEQGRLYEMLIKHDLFDGVDAIPEAVNRVQEELKNFIMERLEVLLGMRAEKEKEVHHHFQEPQFNDMEVQALKMMAAKVTKGASTQAPTSKPVQNELNTVKKEVKQNKINALGSVEQKTKPIRKPVKTKNKVRKKPVFRKKMKLKEEVKSVSAGNMSADQIAKKDMKYIESLEKMSLEDANRVVSERHKRPRPNVEINQEAVNSLYQQKVAVGNSKMDNMAKLMTMAALKEAAKRSE